MNVVTFFEEMKRREPSAELLQTAGVSPESVREIFRSLVPELRSFAKAKDSETLLRQFYQVFDLPKLSFGNISFLEAPKATGDNIVFGSAADYTIALHDGGVFALESESQSKRWRCAGSFAGFASALIKASEYFSRSAFDRAFWKSQEKRMLYAKECAQISGGCVDFYFHLFGVSGGDWSPEDMGNAE
jgi:hypothetical protein